MNAFLTDSCDLVAGARGGHDGCLPTTADGHTLDWTAYLDALSNPGLQTLTGVLAAVCWLTVLVAAVSVVRSVVLARTSKPAEPEEASVE